MTPSAAARTSFSSLSRGSFARTVSRDAMVLVPAAAALFGTPSAGVFGRGDRIGGAFFFKLLINYLEQQPRTRCGVGREP